jgi:integrase/recombinase XerD
MTESRDLTLIKSTVPKQTITPPLPAHIIASGKSAFTAWDDFFFGTIQNNYTRAAYERAVRKFFAWLAPQTRLQDITPGMVGRYFGNQGGYSIPTRKLHMAALRAFFDLLVERHIILMNPAAAVRGQRHSVIEGKTPEITVEQARALIAGIRLQTKHSDGNVVANIAGLRDRAIIGIMFYTAARAGAVAKLTHRHLRHDGMQYSLRFAEKGNKSREIPVRDDLRQWIFEYIEAADIPEESRDIPLFRTMVGRTRTLTDTAMSNIDICRMTKRRLRDAGLPGDISPHSFRVATITDLLRHGAALESVQHLAGHADPRTTRNLVERISNLTEENGFTHPAYRE